MIACDREVARIAGDKKDNPPVLLNCALLPIAD